MGEEGDNGNNNGVVITNKDIYIKVLELNDKVNAAGGLSGTVTDHEARIRSVERWKYAVPPSLLTGGIALLLQILGVHHG